MIPFESLALVPSLDEAPSARAHATLVQLARLLRATGREDRDVLSLTFFIDATDPAVFGRRRKFLHALVNEIFEGDAPPVGVVAQEPAGDVEVALEATLRIPTDEPVQVVRRSWYGVPYTVLEGPGVRQVHGAGLASDAGIEATGERARDALAKMEVILECEGMTFEHVVRQWNYIERMLDIHGTAADWHQGYQDFNNARAVAYGPRAFPAGYPAATGIGQTAGGVAIEFIAVDATRGVTVEPISNPRQTDAHHYSAGVLVDESHEGSTPKFERAKRLTSGEMTFVSGTAAIVGEHSAGIGDVALQTRTTIDNIRVLLDGRPLTQLRAYVKRRVHFPVVRRICEEEFGAIPALYVHADVCRDELLVELEGMASNVEGPRRLSDTRLAESVDG
jgi:enamine deaminase RidA (YjgF/YER057c/UK114 family)